MFSISISFNDGLLFCKIKFYSYKILIAFVSVSGFYANTILLDFRFLLGTETFQSRNSNLFSRMWRKI